MRRLPARAGRVSGQAPGGRVWATGLGDNAALISQGTLVNTTRRNPPKPTPSRISGTLKLRVRDTAEADASVSGEEREPERTPAAPRADKAPPQGRPAREPAAAGREPTPSGRGRPRAAGGERGERGRRPEAGERPQRGGEERRKPDAARRSPNRDRPEAPRATPERRSADAPRRAADRNVPEAPRPAPARRKTDAARAAPAAAPRPPRMDDAVPPEGVRLSKVMAERGICSRREADEFIERGWVFVDGKRVSELGVRIDPEARVTLAPEATRTQQQRVTILLHKPVGYVSGQPEPGYAPAVSLIGADNQFDRDSAQRFHPSQLKNLAPAGRLDIDSTGLLVLTQDGRVARQLIGEDSAIDKEYIVRVEGTLAENGLALLNHGLWLDDRPLRPAQVEWINDDQLRFVLREGRKRQIRRMCELVGLKVVGLKRVRIGRVKLGELPLGQWRYLREDERFG